MYFDETSLILFYRGFGTRYASESGKDPTGGLFRGKWTCTLEVFREASPGPREIWVCIGMVRMVKKPILQGLTDHRPIHVFQLGINVSFNIVWSNKG